MNEIEQKIVELSKQGLTNHQIAVNLNTKHATLCLWKKKIRERGIEVDSKLGRPKLTDPKFVSGTVSE